MHISAHTRTHAHMHSLHTHNQIRLLTAFSLARAAAALFSATTVTSSSAAAEWASIVIVHQQDRDSQAQSHQHTRLQSLITLMDTTVRISRGHTQVTKVTSLVSCYAPRCARDPHASNTIAESGSPPLKAMAIATAFPPAIHYPPHPYVDPYT